MTHESTKKTSEKVPTNYTLCIKGDCPKAANCLRHVAVAMMPAEVQRWSIVSPAYLAQMEGEVPLGREGALCSRICADGAYAASEHLGNGDA